MAYMNREMRRRMRTRVMPKGWVVDIRFSDGTGELMCFASEAQGRKVFDGAMQVRAEEPDCFRSVTLSDPEGREVASSEHQHVG